MSEDITQEEADYLRVRTSIDQALGGDLAEVDAGIVLGALIDISLELIMASDTLTEQEAIENLIATLQELAADDGEE
ncbi:MAG: hypothetical protein JF571_10380 [Asticcacaulis sp.]|nr:hypothetical protein [Asticcacaulis sp.]